MPVSLPDGYQSALRRTSVTRLRDIPHGAKTRQSARGGAIHLLLRAHTPFARGLGGLRSTPRSNLTRYFQPAAHGWSGQDREKRSASSPGGGEALRFLGEATAGGARGGLEDVLQADLSTPARVDVAVAPGLLGSVVELVAPVTQHGDRRDAAVVHVGLHTPAAVQ